jgi:hypothetical protein
MVLVTTAVKWKTKSIAGRKPWKQLKHSTLHWQGDDSLLELLVLSAFVFVSHMWRLQNVTRIILFLKNTKQYNNLSYIFFKIFSLWNYTLLAATVKVLETFLETVLWKPFQLVCCIFNDVRSISNVPRSKCYFKSRHHVKISWSQVRRPWGILQCCYFVLC